MCGITGYWHRNASHAESIVMEMAEHISHRGPDDSGAWVDGDVGLALAHKRLSVIDLSPAGHQPMLSPCRRYVLTYNGEIYNHKELRAELEAIGGHFEWRGHSDTETLLAAIRHWGVHETLQRLNGMFAFALWDAESRELYLARDRMGEKPLYYGHTGKCFLFGSELKSLKEQPDWKAEINRDALTLYLRHGYITAPHSIYKGISKLLPAHYVVVSDSGSNVSEPVCYWDMAATTDVDQRKRYESPEQCVDELEALIKDAVQKRMMSDVSLGAFLSGGIDSSTIVTLMQAQSSRPVQTFSIGFAENEYNEAPHAKSVARHLGTEHTELYVTPEDAISVIPLLPSIWDEPFADPSQIPTYLVSKLARQQVTVGLSGDGGDELFCGYMRYTLGYELWKKISVLPGPLRIMGAWLLRSLSRSGFGQLNEFLPDKYRILNFDERLKKLAAVLNHGTPEALYYTLMSQCSNPGDIVIGAQEPQTLLTSPEHMPKLDDMKERMMYMDSRTYLSDDILAKVDRASMAVSLEVRVPMLDHRLIEFAWKLPISLKYRNGQGKWPLRQILYRYMPKELIERPKMGFGVPIGQWLKGPLRSWAEDLLSENKLVDQGYFRAAPIRDCWQEHIDGLQDNQYMLWNILMFQAWLEAGNA